MATATLSKKQSLSTRFEPQFWLQADGRSLVCREVKKRTATLMQHVGADSFQKELLCQRAVFVGLMLETMEVHAGATGQFDTGRYTAMTNTFCGLLKALGL